MPPKKQQLNSKKKAAHLVTPAAGATPAPPQQSVSWPALTPLLPPSDLQLEEVLPEQILTIPKFFTSTLCKTYVNFLQKSVSLTTTPGKPKRGEAVRVNDRLQIQDPAFADVLWNQSGLKDVVSREDPSLWGGKVVGLNPNIRIYRYGTGQFFDKHYDDANQIVVSDVACRTTWTLLIYLTGAVDGVVGGETVFYTEASKTKKSEEVVVNLEKGLAVLHKHGRDCMLHEGRLVTNDGGVGKWVLRSDLAVKR
ncbi:hypothetical protein FN846DRAFT_964794 [Sphaerosporella brunnea]|uniref:Prolyl 4-hydroxylase alpha subunit domain-containing protein n=1 Tax=Sphaerosporella brunnea TaxID=1250544 RepID=A0A5J5ELJ8_9PEZI|nr:hypothetical protein FN846DRAFT_964794 [Sphaerosporella brunnea]